MNQKLLALYGLKFDPFSPEVPTEALYLAPKIENFCWRIEQAHLREGGFALIHGDPGSGKSVVMRVLAERLARLTDLSVGVVLVRLLGTVHHRLRLFAFPMRTGDAPRPIPRSPGSRTRSVHACQVLRPRRVVKVLALTYLSMLPST